jgi:hypothetical protein
MKNKERHGCLTAWLIYLIFTYSVMSLILFFNSGKATEDTSENMVLLMGSVGILNIFFCILLFNWVKLGFWGILGTNLVSLTIHIINDFEISHSIFGMFCLIALFGLLQLKKNNVSGWKNLE